MERNVLIVALNQLAGKQSRRLRCRPRRASGKDGELSRVSDRLSLVIRQAEEPDLVASGRKTATAEKEGSLVGRGFGGEHGVAISRDDLHSVTREIVRSGEVQS